MKTINKTPIFPGATIDVERRGNSYVVAKRYGAFGNSDVHEFGNPDDALHAAAELAIQKSADMHNLYKALEGSNER